MALLPTGVRGVAPAARCGRGEHTAGLGPGQRRRAEPGAAPARVPVARLGGKHDAQARRGGCCRRVLRDPDERGAARARGGGRGAAQGALRGASPPRQGRGDAARGAGEAHSRALSAVGAEQPRAPCELGGGAEAARPPLAHPLAAPPRRHRPGARGGQGVVPGRPRERRPLSRGGARPRRFRPHHAAPPRGGGRRRVGCRRACRGDALRVGLPSRRRPRHRTGASVRRGALRRLRRLCLL
mmetsp:Transcript_7053/g.21166  ORF Transcript_7053/g.21166 Transcript_7053/m.21166 type:complete len:241 (+) Transcript_7053:1053-1775(+)